MKMKKNNFAKTKKQERKQKMKEKQTNQSAVKSGTNHEEQPNAVIRKFLPVDINALPSTIFQAAGPDGWTTEPLTPSLIKKYDGFEFLESELAPRLRQIIAWGLIVQHPKNDWQYRIADDYVISRDGGKILLIDVDDYPMQRFETIIMERMMRNGLYPSPLKLDLELFCALDTLRKAGAADGYNKIKIDAKAVAVKTGLRFTEPEISLYLNELVRIQVLIQHPSEKWRYKIAEQHLLRIGNVAILLVVPIEDSKSRISEILRLRIMRSGEKLHPIFPVPVSPLAFGVIDAVHSIIISNGTCSELTPDQVFRCNRTILDQEIINKIIEHFIFNKVIERDASGKMQISENFTLTAEGLRSLLVYPNDMLPDNW